VTGSGAASVVAGLVFAFTTANYDSAARLQIVSSQWTPLTLLFLVRVLRHGRLRDGLACGLCFALQGLSCRYYELFLATLLMLSAPFFLVWRRPVRPPWGPLAAGVALAAALLLPMDLAQAQHLKRIDSVRHASQPATAASTTQAMAGNWLYGGLLGLPEKRYDDRYFPGLLPLPLAALGLLASVPAAARRLRLSAPSASRGFVLPFAVFGLTALLLSFGDAGPFRLLNQYVPGFAQTRVPSRFLMFARMSLALFAALGVAALLPLLRRKATAFLAALALLLPLEHLSIPLPVWPVSTGTRMPQVYRWLAELGPEGGPVLEFPPHPPRLRRWESFWQHFSTTHWLPLVNGFASYYPVHYEFVYTELLELPTARSLSILEALGVRYVVFHPKRPDWPEGERAAARFEEGVARFADRLELVKTFDDDAVPYPDPVGSLGGERVYRVRSASGPVGPEACAAVATPIARAGWRCESAPDGDCALALDARPETAFTTRQERGRALRLLFPRPLKASRFALAGGRASGGFPRSPELWGLRDGRWERLPHRDRPLEFLSRMLHCPERAAFELRFEPLTLEGIEVRLTETPLAVSPWRVPEIEMYE